MTRGTTYFAFVKRPPLGSIRKTDKPIDITVDPGAPTDGGFLLLYHRPRSGCGSRVFFASVLLRLLSARRSLYARDKRYFSRSTPLDIHIIIRSLLFVKKNFRPFRSPRFRTGNCEIPFAPGDFRTAPFYLRGNRSDLHEKCRYHHNMNAGYHCESRFF